MSSLVALFFGCAALGIQAVDRIVEEFGSAPTYPSIASAVAAAADGDRILVKNRAGDIPWIENITVDKSLQFRSYADNDFSAALEALRGGGIPVPVTSGANVLWLRAKDINDAWGPSFGIVVNIDTTITGTVGVPVLAANSFRLSPNPARADEGVVITFDRPVGLVQVRVLDAAGRAVVDHRVQQERRIPLTWPGAAPGVYHVGVFVDGVPHWERLVLQ